MSVRSGVAKLVDCLDVSLIKRHYATEGIAVQVKRLYENRNVLFLRAEFREIERKPEGLEPRAERCYSRKRGIFVRFTKPDAKDVSRKPGETRRVRLVHVCHPRRHDDGKTCAVSAIDNATGIEADYACDGFFEAIGLIPENDDFKGFADLNQFGYFDSKEDCVTKTPGLFVAGDCRSKFIRQVATACGDGAVAALAACRYVDLLAK